MTTLPLEKVGWLLIGDNWKPIETGTLKHVWELLVGEVVLEGGFYVYELEAGSEEVCYVRADAVNGFRL